MENQEWSECDNHPCRDTCSSPDLSKRCRYIPNCYPGCICKEGYVENNKGVCVRRELCGNNKII